MKFKPVVILLSTIIFWLASIIPATADPFPAAGFGKADNKTHFVCWDGGAFNYPELNSHLSYINTSVYSLTGAYVVAWPCEPLVDVFYNDNFVHPTIVGQQTCRVPLVGDVCIESDVRINPTLITSAAQAAGVSPSAFRRTVWCHETGHSFGMEHASDDCMISGKVATAIHYSFHHLVHVRLDLSL
jgi:hypothetical protein